MNDIYFYLSGIALVLSIFLIVVSLRAYQRSKIKLLLFVSGTFIVILVDSIIAVLVGFGVIPVPYSMEDMFLVSDLAIMIIFYLGVVRGN